uniref:Major capsid protein N-terminal domain-containing protein n=1 Tax=viral metagenome TaxID=1070528 RepID=A0A6C0I786_9ZZZZ
MTGGLLNIVSYGNQNVILNSNPKKSFFKTTYAKYTNFGLQKFRIDFTGLRNLRMSEESRFTFTVPRYAELLMDTYLVVTMPAIWSPIYPPIACSDVWHPYEFRWIENLGTQMIKEVVFSVGGQILQRMTGKYLLAQVQRDLTGTKRFLYDNMTGSTAELNDPANFSGRKDTYPNVYYNTSQQGPEPSIRGRKLYIPLNAWFCNNSRTAFPLVALQYNELQIDVVMRPVRDLFVTRDITYPASTPAQVAKAPFIQPNFNEQEYQFYRFLQPPPSADISTADVYDDKRTDWNADVHLLSTYCFLSTEESRVFASQEQKYLLKEAYEWDFKNITGSHRVQLQNTMGMVATWMFMFQRSDINLRNQWSNYTNWPYSNMIPDDVMAAQNKGYVINCPIVTNTVLDLDYYKTYTTNPHHATIVVPATDLDQFKLGQSITVTYKAGNTITGTITNIIGTSISFLVSGVTTTAVSGTIYNNSSSSSYITGALTSNYFLLNAPSFNYASTNYIVQSATCKFAGATTSISTISFQLIDNTSGVTYASPTTNTLPAAPSPNTILTYQFVNCFIKNGDDFTLQFNSNQLVNWYSVNISPNPSIRYLGTLTGYPVSYTSGIVTINTGFLPNVIGPGVEPNGTPSGLYVTQDYNVENQREILQQLGILLNGSYRENMLESGVYNYVEKYIRTSGAAPFGLYMYNFGMDANNATYQPSGAINMSKFSTIELEFSTYVPPLDPMAQFYTICDPVVGPIGTNKKNWRIYDYNYDLTVLEERYNVITFIGGNCALMYAR